jgi:CSLREA domain-containing protein
LKEAEISQLVLPFAITSLALGDFIGDEAHRTDIALLSDDGVVHVVQPEKTPWPEARPLRFEISNSGFKPPLTGTQMIRANISSLPTDDLLVLDQGNYQLHILSDLRPETSDLTLNQSAIRHPPSAIVAVLPMRLNMDALSDLVILREGSTAPSVAMTAAAMTFTVNSTADTGDATPDGVCDDGAGNCTLREAIQEANANLGADMIEFALGAGTPSVNTAGQLTITDPVTINGNTGGATRVELNGDFSANDVLSISASSNVVRNLVINRYNGDGIRLQVGSSGNIIEGNFIGTDVTGTADLGNSRYGVAIVDAPGNTIGGDGGGRGQYHRLVGPWSFAL